MFSRVPLTDLFAMLAGPEVRKTNARNLALWSEAYRRASDREDVTINYLLQLWNVEAIEPLARQLTEAVQRFPKSETIHTLWAEFPLTWGDPQEAVRRTEVMLAKFPSSEALRYRAYQIYLSYGDFDAARKMALRLFEGTGYEEYSALASLADKYKEVQAAWAVQPGVRDYHIYCIGLDRQPRRFQRVQAQLQRMGATVKRVSGVDGRTLPDLASRMLTHSASSRMKGTLGCFLSHVRVWELCAQSDKPYAFVTEDDTCFLLPPPPSTEFLNTGGHEFDLCFVNERTQNAGYLSEQASFDQPLPLGTILPHEVEGFRGIGTDGYFVSREAARKLLDMVGQDGLVGDVDWRLMLYAVSDDEIDATKNEFIRETLKMHRGYRKSSGKLETLITAPAIVRTYNGGSIRGLMNDFDHAHEEKA